MERLIIDMQAVSESYTIEYVASHIDTETTIILMRASKYLIEKFIVYYRGYIEDIGQKKLWIDTIDVNQKEMLLLELDTVEKEQSSLQQDVKMFKDSLSETNNEFDIERKWDENSKSFGQPFWSNTDYILYDDGIDRSGAFGGAIEGNYCYQWMPNTKSIFGELMDFYWRPIQG